MNATVRHALLSTLPQQARTLVQVRGEDATRFLQGLLTADVGELTPGRATPAALLTVKGKIVSEVWVLAANADEPILAFPRELGEAVTKLLDDHIIMDDVELEPLPQVDCLLVWKDGGALALANLPAAPEHVTCFEGVHPLPGIMLVGSSEHLTALAASGDYGTAADADAFTAARVQHGRPAWGHELRADRFPPEVGYVDAVSYDKGCYLGQEPLSRIHNRGQVNRVMVRVKLEGEPGALPVALAVADKEVGELTSATTAGTGLAIVRRKHAQPGTQLKGEGIEVEITSVALGDDPGGPSRQKSASVSLGGPR